MPNKPRIEEPGAFYHVNANALHGLALYRDEIDRMHFFEMLAEESAKSEWTVIGYTLLTTHYHVLLSLKKCTLSSGFQRLQSRYARSYNARYARRGVVWQRRFHDRLVETDGHLLEVIRYVALNAPRARMVDAAEDWPWCSYGAAIGRHAPDPLVDEQALLELFSPNVERARQRLQAYVEEKDPRVRWRQSKLRASSDAEA